MVAQVEYIIALVCAGFLMGVLLEGKPNDCATQQLAPIPKATATMHHYRHTPHAVPIP
jgi:hypothetical protein